MKKIMTLAVASLVLALGVAIAGSVTVPFFNDTDKTTNGAFPDAVAAGEVQPAKAFIGLKNTTDTAIVIEVSYFDGNGNPVGTTKDPVRTFLLGAQEGVSFRPGTLDTSSEGTLAQGIPDMAQTFKGSARFTHDGGPGALVGRVVTYWRDNTGNAVSDSFLCPWD